VAGNAPEPERAGSLDDFVNELRALKLYAGNPSITEITRTVCRTWQAAGRPASELPARATVGGCFRPGRTRPNPELLLAIVAALVGGEPAVVQRWRQSLLAVLGEIEAAGQVSASDRLPADLPEFVGRAGVLAAAEGLLDTDAPVLISAINGMAGIGKTALAVHLAHRVLAAGGADRVLFVNLRGYHPTRAAADPAAVLDSFLRLLGVPGHRIPHALDTRAALYRDVVAGTATLVVLDNAAGTDQVIPLLPGAPNCPVLITSRDELGRLPGVLRLPLPVFTAAEALDLLRRSAGAARIDTDQDAAARIAGLLGHLPLALAVIGSHLRDHPDWTLADYPPALTPLALEGGVRAALALSDASQPPQPRLLLRRLAQHPGQDFDRYAAAALAGQDLAATTAGLDLLVAATLLQPRGAGRYGFHDLTRAYAAERAALDHPHSHTSAALRRLYHHYAHAASAAMDAAYPYEAGRRPPAPPTDSPGPDLTDPAGAAAWLDAEQANLLAVARHAAAHGVPGHTLHQSGTLHRHLQVRGAHADAVGLHQAAAELASGAGDRAAETTALNNLGQTHYLLDRYGPAADCHTRALALALDGADQIGELIALNGLARTHHIQGRPREATDCLNRALLLARRLRDATGELDALHGLGYIHYVQGRYGEAIDCHRAELDLARATGSTGGELRALDRLGVAYQQDGRYEPAADCLDRALRLAEASNDPDGELNVLSGLAWLHLVQGRNELAADYATRGLALARAAGNANSEAAILSSLAPIHRAAGRTQAARDCYQRILDLAGPLGDRNLEYEGHQGLGRIHLDLGHPELGLAAHAAALVLATQLDQAPDQARAHDGLAQAHCALGHRAEAREHWELALAILTKFDIQVADDVVTATVRAHLAAVSR
jgi:tetratricopeptide (TPR) repeat protein